MASDEYPLIPVSDALVERIDRLEIAEVLDLGPSPDCIRQGWPQIVSQRIVLTGERYGHILKNHPEMRGFERAIVMAALDPDCVHRNNRDAQIAVLYRAWQEGLQIRIALWISNDARFHNSIHSARFARMHERTKGIEKGRMVWKKD